MELGLWRGAFEKYRLPVRGALHVGAHDCLEMQLYGAAGLAKCDVLWVEALHTVVERVRARDPKLMLVQGVVSDTDDVDVGFRIASDEVSSSVYEFGSCAHMRPSARVDRVERVRTVTLDTLLARHAGAGARRGRNFLRLDVQGAELAALRGFSAGIAEIDYVVCRVYCAGAYKEGGATPEQVDAHLNASGLSRIETWWLSDSESCGDTLYMRRAAIAHLHVGRTVRRPERPCSGGGRTEKKTGRVHENKTIGRDPRAPRPRRESTGVSIFVIVQSQAQLLQFAASYATVLTDIGFVFVGAQAHDAIADRPDTIVVSQSVPYTESQRDVLAFTAWSLLITHDLVDTSHVFLLQADVEFDDPAQFMLQLRALPNSPNSPPAPTPSLRSPSSSALDVAPDIVSFGQPSVGAPTDLPLFAPLLAHLGLDVDVDSLSVLPGLAASGHCLSRRHLEAFVCWYEPRIASVRAADPDRFSAHHERMAHAFAVARRVRHRFMPGMRRAAAAAGAGAAAAEACPRAAGVAPRLLCAPTETGALRPAAIPTDFDWRFYAREASAFSGLRIATEEAAEAHWALRGAYAAIGYRPAYRHVSTYRTLHRTVADSRTLIETGAGTGDGIADALACGFERVVSIEADFAHYAYCCARFSADRRVQLVYGSSALVLGACLAQLVAPAVLRLDTGCAVALEAELRQFAAQKSVAHTVMVGAAHFVDASARNNRAGVRRTLAAINGSYVFASGEGADTSLIARLNTHPLGSSALCAGGGNEKKDSRPTVTPAPYRALRIVSATYGADEKSCVDVARQMQTAIDTCEWRATTPTDVCPGDLGADPCPGRQKQLRVVYQDLDGVYRERTLSENRDAWSPAAAPRQTSTVVLAIQSARYAGTDVRARLHAALVAASREHRGPVDLTAVRPSALLGGDPAPGTAKRLDIEALWMLDFEATVTQHVSIDERDDAWRPHDNNRWALRFPPADVMADRDARLLVYEAAPASLRASAPMLLLPPPTQCRRRLFVVYHIALIGDWQSVVTPQVTALCASGLVRECERIYVSVVGAGASTWTASPCFGAGEWQRKVTVAHRSESAAQYERTAIRILQTLIPEDRGVCCLYLHSKGVSIGASVTVRSRNVALWRQFMEYYVVEHYRVCVDVLLEDGYDTCGVQWTNNIWWFQWMRCLVTPHYSGNFWWATGAYLAKLRHTAPSRVYIGPELWIGLHNPRAWSLHNSPYTPPKAGLYENAYARDRYADRFSLPSGRIFGPRMALSAPADITETRSAESPDTDPGAATGETRVRALSVQIVVARYGDKEAAVDVRAPLLASLRDALSLRRALDLRSLERTPARLFGDPCPGRKKELHVELRLLVHSDAVRQVTETYTLHEHNDKWDVPEHVDVLMPPLHIMARVRDSTLLTSDTCATLPAVSADTDGGGIVDRRAAHDSSTLEMDRPDGGRSASRVSGAAPPRDRPVRWMEGVVRAITLPMRGDYRSAKWPVAMDYRSDDDDDDDDREGESAGSELAVGRGGGVHKSGGGDAKEPRRASAEEIVVHEATYGSAEVRIDVASRLRKAIVPRLALSLTETINAPSKLLPVADPVPGAAKYLEVRLEHGVCATSDSVCTAYGAEAVARDVDGGSESKSATGALARLRRTLRVEERNRVWRTPKTVVPYATLSLVVQSGMSNQIYGMAAGCMIARHTHRALIFPFRVVARRDALDSVCVYSMPPPELDRAFEHLFDAAAFLAHLPCMTYCTDEPRLVSHIDDDGKQSAALECGERRRRLRRALVHGDTKLNVRPEIVCVESSELESAYALSAQHILAMNPFFGVVPDTQTDYNHVVDVLLSVRPALRLQRIADRLVAVLRRQAMCATGSDRFVTAHCRQEPDWERAFGTSKPPAYDASVRKYLEGAGLLRKRGVGIGVDVGIGGDNEGDCKVSCTPVAVYMLGGSANDAYWTQLVDLSSDGRDGRRADIAWMRKELWLDEIPELAALGFEEAAVVDREVGLQAHYCIGFPGSTLSSLLIVEREAMGRASAPVMLNYPPHWLLAAHGQSLYPYTGLHPRAKHARQHPV